MFEELFDDNLRDSDMMAETNMKENLVRATKNQMYNRADVGTFVGSPLYVAPEMLNESSSGPFSDLWALGVILYELITGTSPWKGNTNAQKFEEILSGSINFSDDMDEDARDLIE